MWWVLRAGWSSRVSLARAREGQTPPARFGRPLLSIVLFLSSMLILGGTAGSGLVAPVAPVAAASPVAFPGPAHGVPTTQAPPASDFLRHCNAYLTTAVGHAGGATIMTDTALLATTGCGEAVLLISAPGQGRFHATFALADDDTTGKPGVVRVRVIGSDGYSLRYSEVTVSRANAVRPVDVDVAQAGAVVLDFLSSAKTYLYDVHLSGTARALGPAAGNGSALPAGAAPVDIAGATHSCNAYPITTPISATFVGIDAARSMALSGCGQVTLGLPPGARGTLLLRYGMADTATAGVSTLSVSVLAANGHLLRKAIGVTFLGSGLRPLWVDVGGGSTVTLSVDGDSGNPVIVTAVGRLPGQLPLYRNASFDHIVSGGGSRVGVSVPIRSFVSTCNAYVGTSDTSVAREPLFAGTYIDAPVGCGATRLIFAPLADGTLHALFGVPANAPGGAQPRVTVVASSSDNTPLYRRTFRAAYGAPGVPIDVPLRRGSSHVSVLSFTSFAGARSVLYDLRLTGTAGVYAVLYPPVESPLSTPGGVAVSPYDFTRQCNAYVATDDLQLVGEVALQDWALTGTACGEADLALSGTRYPHNQFSARLGIQNQATPDSTVTMRFAVIDAAGKVIRHKDFVVRYGYGPLLNPRISLAGGARLAIMWLANNTNANVAVYAMTAS